MLRELNYWLDIEAIGAFCSHDGNAEENGQEL